MPLTNYQEVRPWVKSIRAQVANRTMPPWHADPGDFAFANDRSLPQKDIDLITTWADAGAPEGDPSLVPPMPEFKEGWSVGTPDIVLKMSEPWTIPAQAAEEYRSFLLDHRFDEDTWVRAVEITPGNPRVVHHVNVWSAPYDACKARDAADPGAGWKVFMGIDVKATPQSYLGGYAPGVEPPVAPDGTALLIPKGNAVVIEVHYFPTGQPEQDQTSVGIYFARGPVRHEIRMAAATTEDFHIPPGMKDYRVRTTTLIPFDAHIQSMIAHMHLLGRAMRVDMLYPDGRTAVLLKAPRFDFNWQNFYMFKEPVAVPKGTVIVATATYDNSAGNPRNPNSPPIEVRFGPSTKDEMMGAHFFYTKDDQEVPGSAPASSLSGKK